VPWFLSPFDLNAQWHITDGISGGIGVWKAHAEGKADKAYDKAKERVKALNEERDAGGGHGDGDIHGSDDGPPRVGRPGVQEFSARVNKDNLKDFQKLIRDNPDAFDDPEVTNAMRDMNRYGALSRHPFVESTTGDVDLSERLENMASRLHMSDWVAMHTPDAWGDPYQEVAAKLMPAIDVADKAAKFAPVVGAALSFGADMADHKGVEYSAVDSALSTAAGVGVGAATDAVCTGATLGFGAVPCTIASILLGGAAGMAVGDLDQHFLNPALHWVNHAVDDAGNAIGGAVGDAGNAIGGAVDDAGNAIGGAADDVGSVASSVGSFLGL